MKTAVIADDEPIMRAALRKRLAETWPDLHIVAEAEDGPSALIAIESFSPDVAFLDIRMPGMTGLEVAHALTAKTRVVFVTAHADHAVEAFEANAFDYIIKPVQLPRLYKIVTKLKQDFSENNIVQEDRLIKVLAQLGFGAGRNAGFEDMANSTNTRKIEWLQVSVGQQIRLANIIDVMYFESDTKYTRVVTEEFEGLIRKSLKEIVEGAPENVFVQTHRSVVVNLRFIKCVHRIDDSIELELKGRSERLKVSASNHHLFRAM